MPELPEVEFGRTVAESVARGRVVHQVRCARDAIVFGGVSPQKFSRALRGKQVRAVKRWGKQLWFEMEAPPHPLFHFGMTGSFRAPGRAALTLASSPAGGRESWPPRFAKIRLTLDDGGELVMVNKRRLGRILLRDDPEREPPVSKLGFDPLLALPGPAVFSSLLRRRKAPLKAVLMDQGFAAGVGNWIADEILYQARLAPMRRANELSEAEARRIRSKMKSVIEKAVSVGADKSRFPRSWLFHYRWGRQSGAITARGEAIHHVTIGGRTTAWVPAVQSVSGGLDAVGRGS